MTIRAALLASLLAPGLIPLPALAAAPPPAEENVTYAYAPVLHVTPVLSPVRAGSERRVVAYDVEYQYKGQTFVSRLDHDPGRRLRIRIAITPDETVAPAR